MSKQTILVVDDQEINREILKENFQDTYRILEAENGKIALDLINEHHNICAVLLDVEMPVMDGLTVLRKMKENGLIKRIPVFVITAANDDAILEEAYRLGAADFMAKPFKANFYSGRISNSIDVYRRRNDLQYIVEDQGKRLNYVNTAMIETLATLIEFRDCESGEHVKRICGLTKIILQKFAAAYPQYNISDDAIEKIMTAAALHDVGKISIPDAILQKPGRLTPEEFEIIKTHTTKGYEILARIPNMLDKEVYSYCMDICLHHHERYDGKGYPEGLSKDEISPWAQVVALADVYDALTSVRCYKPAYTQEKAVQMILNGECGSFNPKLLEVFGQIIGEMPTVNQQ